MTGQGQPAGFIAICCADLPLRMTNWLDWWKFLAAESPCQLLGSDRRMKLAFLLSSR